MVSFGTIAQSSGHGSLGSFSPRCFSPSFTSPLSSAVEGMFEDALKETLGGHVSRLGWGFLELVAFPGDLQLSLLCLVCCVPFPPSAISSGERV